MNISEFESATENVLIPQGNLEINVDEWRPGNPLWVTGSSGDGKSTLAIKMAKENGATVISSDIVLCRLKWTKEKFYSKISDPNTAKSVFNMDPKNSPAMDYVLSHPDLPYDTKDPITRAYKSEIMNPCMIDFYEWLMDELATNPKYKNKLYVIEGCDICLLDANIMKDKPLIIVGGSRIRSVWRRAKRHSSHTGDSLISAIFMFIKNYDLTFRRLDDNKDAFHRSIKSAIKDGR